MPPSHRLATLLLATGLGTLCTLSIAAERSAREIASLGLAMTYSLTATECATAETRPTDDFFGELGIRTTSRPRSVQSSAIAIDAKGHLISVALDGDCSRYQVTRPDGDKFEAELVAFDPTSTVGLLRGAPLVPPALGDPGELLPGDPLWVFGTAWDMPGTIGHGILSNPRRYLRNQLEGHFLQTDAPTHRGQSGGPVLDASGRLVGLNAYILARGGRFGFDGMAFAMPIDVAMRIADDLLQHGRYRPGRLGIDIEPDATDSGLPLQRPAGGILVTDVGRRGPSHDRLRVGDRIVAIDGRALTSSHDLMVTVRLARPGQTLDLTVLRDGHTLQVPIIAALGE